MSEKREDIVEERVYNVPLSRVLISPVKKRTPRAMHVLKAFVTKHMKPESLVISDEVNTALWEKGIEGAPHHLRIRAAKGKDNTITVYLAKEE
jgi:large subunit ribosomal protein L31e